MRNTHRNCLRSTGRGPLCAARFAIVLLGFVAAGLFSGRSMAQEQAAEAGVLAPGNAAVSGFSGAVRPVQIAPGDDPAILTFIDLNEPSLRVADLQHMGGPPLGQLVAVPKPLTVPASETGQVFAVALDDGVPPNIYAAATSAYGLPIVARGPGGQARHVRAGNPGAEFMAGLWGPAPAKGGPGSIWRIDGRTGAVSLFANITLDGRANTGPALGGLAYDAGSHSLFAADRETGMMHRYALDGREIGRFDHGVAGRGSQGLREVPFQAGPGLNIKSPSFDSANPDSWGYAPDERRVFGLGVFQHRLYYAVAAKLQIWSAAIEPGGAFGGDARLEITVPPGKGPTEISKITFDEQNRMYLAERPAPTGAYDFKALAFEGIGRVLRYRIAGTNAKGLPVWQLVPDEYAIGFPRDMRNGNGGVAIGYTYDNNGELNRSGCGGFMWSTGEELRRPGRGLQRVIFAPHGEAEADVDGLQGNGTWRIRHRDYPPIFSYFVRYADEPGDAADRGHMGDIAIALACAAKLQPGTALPAPFPARRPRLAPPSGATPPPPPPPPPVPPGCSPDTVPIGANGYCCDSSKVYTAANGASACCLIGAVSNGACVPPPPPPPPGNCVPPCCASGYVPVGGSCCLASQMTSTGTCCSTGTVPSGSQCSPPPPPGHIIIIPPWTPPGRIPPVQCCPAGQVQATNGQCCPIDQLNTSGVCCQSPPDPGDRRNCPSKIQLLPLGCAAGYTKMPDSSCCLKQFVSPDGKSCERRTLPGVPVVPWPDCSSRGANSIRDPRHPHRCIACKPGWRANPSHTACIKEERPHRATCPDGSLAPRGNVALCPHKRFKPHEPRQRREPARAAPRRHKGEPSRRSRVRG